MSNSVNGASTPAGTDPATPALTADEMVNMLREMRARIPDFTQFTSSDVRSLVPVGSLDRDFVLGSIQVTGSTPTLQQIIGSPQEALLQDASDNDAWTIVEEELRGLLKGVAAANLARRHRIGSAALLAYNVSRQLVKKPEFVNLIPHVEQLKRLRRLGRRKQAAPQPQTPSTTPATPQQTTPQKQS